MEQQQQITYALGTEIYHCGALQAAEAQQVIQSSLFTVLGASNASARNKTLGFTVWSYHEVRILFAFTNRCLQKFKKW